MALHTLRLLHISDIHMRGGREKERWRRREVLGSAWHRNIEELLRDGPIDLVCLTGDVANSGQPDEYDEATAFIMDLLGRIGQPVQRLFVVPGNHDIDREQAKSAWKALRKHLPSTETLDTSRWLAGGRTPTTRGLTTKHRDDVFLRQRAYQDWVTTTLGRPELHPGKSPHGRLGYRVKLDIPSLPFPVFLIGLDSAWLAGDNSDAENLLLTDNQIMSLAADESGAPLPGLRLAMVHHPLHNLVDHMESQRRLGKHVDLLFRGHLHHEDTANELRPDGALFQIAAGCLYEGSKANAYPNSCQALTLTLNELGKLQRFEIRFRTWSPQGHWHDDPGRYASAPRGRLACVQRNTAEGVSWQFGPADENQDRPPAGPANSEQKRVSVGLESVLDGLRTLPAGPQVRKFLDTYLGTREHPEPFGGRTKELQELRRWFDALSLPSMVVSAPAGSGKSALLCRFCEEITKRSDVAVVYFPISIRYQTSLENRCVPALVSRLCHLHGEAPPKLEHTSSEQWRSLLDQYLTRSLPDGRTLLLVLDGLDETTGWQVDRTFLPVQPAERVRILVAARIRVGEVGYDGWRQSLGWASPAVSTGMSLSGLDVDGVAEAITSLGMPLDRVALRSELVVQIHRLSRGEPLLVQLWCHRLWQNKDQALTLTPAQLEKYPPGLKGYLQEFWDARNPEEKSALHERKTAQLLLEILASALGPLSRDDLRELIPEILSMTELKDALVPLARFVEGNGREQGYVLRHSLLRDHFREEEMTTEQCREQDERFLRYGERTLAKLTAGQLQPQAVSVYLLQNLGSHIGNATNHLECGRLGRQLALVTNPWRLAWERHENGVGGFLNDVQQAWESAASEELSQVRSGQPSKYLPEIVRCAACVAAQRTRTHGIYYRLFERLVEQGVWSVRQALSYVQQMGGGDHLGSQRKTLFAFLLPRLPDDLLRRALPIALEMVNAKFPDGSALFALWERLAKFCTHDAVEAVLQIRWPSDRIAHLATLAKHVPSQQAASLYAEASLVAHSYSDPGESAAVLERLADHLPESERVPLLLESFDAALRILSPAQRAFRLSSLLPKLPQRLGETALDALLDATVPLNEDHDGRSLLDAIGSFLPSTQQRVVHRIWADPKGPAAVLQWLTNSFHPASEQATDHVSQRWRIASRVGVKLLKPAILASLMKYCLENAGAARDLVVTLAPHLSAKFLQEALTLLRQHAPPWALADALCLVGHHISPAATIEGLHLLFRLDWPTDGAYCLELRFAFSRLSEIDRTKALTIVAETTQPQAKAWASYWLADMFTGRQQQQLLEQAASAALLIPSANHKADFFLQFWPHVEGAKRESALHAGLNALDAMRSTGHKIRRLTRLASQISQPYCDQLLRVALEEMSRLERGYRHGAVLMDLLQTRGISPELKDEILRQALHAVRSSKPVYAPDLTDLCKYAPAEQQNELLVEALDAARRLRLRREFLQTAFVLRPSLACQQKLLRLSESLGANERLTLFYCYTWPNLDESLQPALVRRELDAIRCLPEHDVQRLTARVRVLARVPVSERETLVREACAVAREFLEQHHDFLHQVHQVEDDDINRDESDLSLALQSTLPRLFEHRLAMAEAVALVPLIPDAWHESQAAVLQLFDGEERIQRFDALQARLRALPDQELSYQLFVVANRLHGDERTQGIADAMTRALPPTGSSTIDARGLWLVAPHLESSHLDSLTNLLVICLRVGRSDLDLSQILLRLPAWLQSALVARLLELMTAWLPHIQDQVLVACASYVGIEWHERVVAALPRFVQPHMSGGISQFAAAASERLLMSAFTSLAAANGTLAPTEGQAAALAVVGTELLRRKPATQPELWPTVLTILRRSAQSVHELHILLRHLAPLLRAAVGVDMIDKTVETLLEQCDWWET